MRVVEISCEETWNIRHQVMWPNKPYDYIKLECDASGLHFGLYEDEMLISVISVFIDGNTAQFRKFATLVEYQNLGYGSGLLKYILSYLEENNIHIVWCNARKEKIGYYNKFGLYETTEGFIKGNIEYVIMKREMQKHLS